MTTIYIDGDGPLQDFAKWMVDNKIPLGYNRSDTEAEFHLRIEEIFLESPPAKYLSFFLKLYTSWDNVKVLTAVGDHWIDSEMKEKAICNKVTALSRLGFKEEDIVVVNSGSNKIAYATADDGICTTNILYDDKWSTIKEWEAAGGLGFFVPECYLRFEEAGHGDKT